MGGGGGGGESDRLFFGQLILCLCFVFVGIC